MMDEKTAAHTHRVLINNRQNGSFSGISDVLSFDVSEILLETEQGMLLIKGKDLHVNRLSLEKGHSSCSVLRTYPPVTPPPSVLSFHPYSNTLSFSRYCALVAY